MQLRQIDRLDECYRLESGTLFLTGLQALVRVLLTQRYRDERENLNTAGFVSGYRGSPLGGLDRELWRAGPFLDASHVKFEPGLNEDLAATSIWGTQQANLFAGARYDGVYSLWYGKGPGVDRSGDAFKHGNSAGTSAHGGVLVAAGDDHTCKSSSLPQQSEYSFIDAMMPVLNPADVQELLDYGLYGFALSRFSGCWVALKVIQETADATQTVSSDPDALRIVTPAFEMPPGGLNIRWPDPPNDQEYRLQRHKLNAALAFARANALNYVAIESSAPRLGIVTTGKAHLDVLQALEDLGISRRLAAEIGITIFKVGMSWPLEPQGIREFAEGLDEIIVVEEKRGVIESQLKEQLYNWQAKLRPLIIGKHDEHGEWILPSTGELTPARIARVLARRMQQFHSSADVDRRVRFLEEQERHLALIDADDVRRMPHFCSGCPHNSSTRVPEGSRAVGGIGCHFMAAWMDRDNVTYTQMGGEGATWIGQAPFTETKHVFQNLGDGTYAHSGILAIRAAVAAGVNITYKILFNDAVAMTGGQPVEGNLTVARVAQQLAAEGVEPIVVVSDQPDSHGRHSGLPAGVAVHHRRKLDSLQRDLRERTGVSALIYDQTCAAELRRKRKKNIVAAPSRRVVINEAVCEGCGDCNKVSNCLSVTALETEFGRKRAINQSSCNYDFSCLEGFCPSFVTLEGAAHDPVKPLASETVPNLPEPATAELGTAYNILIAGIGGTGVVTASGLIGLAAHLEGKVVLQLDQTGLAQKFGGVLSHVRIAPDRERVHGMRIPAGQVDLLLGSDLIVAAEHESLSMLSPERSTVIVNTHEEMPPRFVLERDFAFPGQRLLAELRSHSRPERLSTLDATRLASALFGDSIGANVFMLGFAFQHGLLPLSSKALYRALELYGVNVKQNKQAFDWGRFTAESPDEVEAMAGGIDGRTQLSSTLAEVIGRREEFLEAYQDRAYAERYSNWVRRIGTLEQSIRPGSTALADAVARNYFKLLAYKDEYEVARLYTRTDFLANMRKEFGSSFKFKFHFSPPLIAGRDPDTGRPRKYRFGGWILPLLKVLAGLKGLRGTKLDIFGYSGERRLERRLIADYEALLEKFVAELDEPRLDLATELAALPHTVRGFGPIKAAAVERFETEHAVRLSQWDEQPGEDDQSPARASAA
ncbi:indolepyruvate ferredoxin oxidoreductase family protein [Candidatus Rariloculus sp.]|uniref:indolepyruvate ferredoxin oxidoreductase family protein n=1 Tax=Candidatus Rariloculus sp. TaxID=3101265 RepID=UPI003D0EDB5F